MRHFAGNKNGRNIQFRPFAISLITLLAFTFAGYESISPWTANANIGSITTCDLIVSTAAEDAVITAETVNCICAGTTQDQVIAFRAGDCPCASDEIR